MYFFSALTINSDTSQHLAENSQDKEELEAGIEEVKHSSELQLEGEVDSLQTKYQVSSKKSEIDHLGSQGERQSGKSKDRSKKINKPGKTKIGGRILRYFKHMLDSQKVLISCTYKLHILCLIYSLQEEA